MDSVFVKRKETDFPRAIRPRATVSLCQGGVPADLFGRPQAAPGGPLGSGRSAGPVGTFRRGGAAWAGGWWLVKSDPDTYGWNDLVRDGRTSWDGVRSFAARNHLRGMKPGDEVLFYHSGT